MLFLFFYNDSLWIKFVLFFQIYFILRSVSLWTKSTVHVNRNKQILSKKFQHLIATVTREENFIVIFFCIQRYRNILKKKFWFTWNERRHCKTFFFTFELDIDIVWTQKQNSAGEKKKKRELKYICSDRFLSIDLKKCHFSFCEIFCNIFW